MTAVSEWIALYSNGGTARFVAADVRAASVRADQFTGVHRIGEPVDLPDVVAIFTIEEWQTASARIMAGYVSNVETGTVGP